MRFQVFSSIPILLRERAGRARGFMSLGRRGEPVHPAERTYSPAALHLDDEDLARIRSAAEFFPLEIEMQRMRGGSVTSAPVTLRRFRNAMLLDGDLFLSGARLRVRSGRAHRLHMGSLGEVDHAALASSQLGCTFFGHWLLDDIPRYSSLKDLAADPFLVVPATSAHQHEYLAAFGLSPRVLGDCVVKELSVLEEGTMQSFKAQQLAGLSSALRGSGEHRSAHAGVMLMRGGSGRRRILVNEQSLAELLAARGFRVVDPMKSSVAEIVSACAAAPVVVGIEGSHMAHAVLAMAAGTAFVTIQPPYKFDNTCKPYCDALAVKYAFTVGTAADEGFQIEPDRVLRMIDKAVESPLDRASYAR
jgi:hypothetical protein